MLSKTRAMFVFPTQVGVILKSRCYNKSIKGVPHTGGGDPEPSLDLSDGAQCSPHRWG